VSRGWKIEVEECVGGKRAEWAVEEGEMAVVEWEREVRWSGARREGVVVENAREVKDGEVDERTRVRVSWEAREMKVDRILARVYSGLLQETRSVRTRTHQ
jgi:hypothetical protein